MIYLIRTARQGGRFEGRLDAPLALLGGGCAIDAGPLGRMAVHAGVGCMMRRFFSA